MINKLFPRKLNRSLDSKLRKPEDMIDAINVVIGDEFSQEGDGANSSVGNVGVLKPVVSNRGISNNTEADQLPHWRFRCFFLRSRKGFYRILYRQRQRA